MQSNLQNIYQGRNRDRNIGGIPIGIILELILNRFNLATIVAASYQIIANTLSTSMYFYSCLLHKAMDMRTKYYLVISHTYCTVLPLSSKVERLYVMLVFINQSNG